MYKVLHSSNGETREYVHNWENGLEALGFILTLVERGKSLTVNSIGHFVIGETELWVEWKK